ncbi:YfhO family protein, partial [Micromonospora zhanjiangensis]
THGAEPATPTDAAPAVAAPAEPVRGWRRWAPYPLAALVVAVAFCVSGNYRRTVPFGPLTRSTNDLGDQSVPIHGYLRDLLLGHAEGGLLVNWRSGWGVSFLPDLYTYATSPFSLLVLLFPRDRMDDALFVVILLKMMVAAIAMVAFLRSTGRGRWWLLGLFGAGYGLCGWAVDDAAYVPQWLDGLILFPLLCLVGRWRRDNRRFLLGVLVAGYGWLANFYTAYMATIAAGLVLLCGLLIERTTWRDRALALSRFAGTVLCGIVAVLPLLLPTYLAAKQAAGSTVVNQPFTPIPWVDFLSRLLPATEGVGFSASIYVGTLGLVLVATLPWHRGVPARARIGWLVLVVALVASFRWTPTVTAWHLFDEPQGSSYREAFVLCGVLLIAGWQAVAAGLPRWPALAGGAGVVA